MAGRNDCQEDEFVGCRSERTPVVTPRAHNFDDDWAGYGAYKPLEMPDSNRAASRPRSTKPSMIDEVIVPFPYKRSRPGQPSPPPINRRRFPLLNERQGDPPQRPEAPNVYYLTSPNQNYYGDGRVRPVRDREASDPVTPEFAKSQPAVADLPTTLPDTAVEVRRPARPDSPRSGLTTPALSPSADLRQSVSEDPSQRLSSSSGVLGDKVYRLTPLEAEEFRLVRVLAARSSQVKCEILHRPFGNPPNYIAISYAWGDPSDTTKIKIRDEHYAVFVEVHISKSLYYALEAVRRKGEDVLVWADALSIDQQNRNEKNEQLSLMAGIYKKAQYVAVWLGPEADDSNLATSILQDVAVAAQTGAGRVRIKSIFSFREQDQCFPALAALFEREYWNRLWIVQEIFNAASIYVYCGSSGPLPWDFYQTASRVFQKYKNDLEDLFPKHHSIASHKQYSFSQILAYSGPGSLPELGSLVGLGDEALLEVMRVCRRKLASDPKDKVFGVLGVLDKDIREEFVVDYGKPVKDVYTDVVDFLLTTTDRLDVICEAIHFPIYTSSARIPTWVPDWSHIPATSAISLSPGADFAASRDAKANYKFLGERRNRLKITAIPLGKISRHGIPVGTLCTLQDYLMAFLNWRVLFLQAGESDPTPEDQEEFCETICFRQIPPKWKDKGRRGWMEACLHVFACLIQDRLPRLAIDAELAFYADVEVGVRPEENRRFLQDHFGSRMMGRCFCLTDEGRTGLGTGFMAPDDEVVVPLGCSTPVLLRPEGNRGEYRFVGDIYVHGYMHGEAVDDLDSDKRQLKRYILH